MTWTQIGILAAAVLVEVGRAMTADGVQTFMDVLTPAVIGSAVLNLGLQLGGLLSKGPQKP